MVQQGEKILIYFSHDHDALDQFFVEFQHWKYKDYSIAKEHFKQFKFGLQRHIVWEEEILFPIFEKKTGLINEGPTVVMRMEHQQIKNLLGLLHKKVQQQNPDSDEEEQSLIRVLENHNDKEEGLLYPAIDQMMSLEERALVYKKMEDIPPQAYMSCGCSCH
ncbi:MAG: hemerythrin domain-containing protein [Candidatus Omnitrophica bacterium]|nr:hemerythrin domain-containing protein [Candidatus Omnitrophota bacterium]